MEHSGNHQYWRQFAGARKRAHNGGGNGRETGKGKDMVAVGGRGVIFPATGFVSGAFHTMTKGKNMNNAFPGWRLICVAIFAALAAGARADAPATFKVGEINFIRPPKWEWVEVNSPMRKAQLKVSDAKEKGSAEVVFFQFGPGPMGGVKANVDRWFRQFQEPREKINAKTEDVTVGKTKVTYVQAEGTYLSGMPGGTMTPMTDYALEGAIIDTADGNIFVKMTGPKVLVKASVIEFKKMVETGLK
jgi:hypothetical protein